MRPKAARNPEATQPRATVVAHSVTSRRRTGSKVLKGLLCLHPSSLTSDLPMRRLRALAAQPLARLTQTRQFGFYVSEKRPVLQTSAARQALDVDARAEWQSRVEERNRAIASWRPTTWRGARGRIPPKPKPLTRPGWRPRPGRPLLAVRLLEQEKKRLQQAARCWMSAQLGK